MEVKRLTDENDARDAEIASLRAKVQYTEDKINECEGRIEDAKSGLDAGENAKVTGEGLSRKVSLLEAELEVAERNLGEATEKYVPFFLSPFLSFFLSFFFCFGKGGLY